eukprot:9488125-Pyramimonas_sp.AAC.1
MHANVPGPVGDRTVLSPSNMAESSERRRVPRSVLLCNWLRFAAWAFRRSQQKRNYWAIGIFLQECRRASEHRQRQISGHTTLTTWVRFAIWGFRRSQQKRIWWAMSQFLQERKRVSEQAKREIEIDARREWELAHSS